MSPSRGVEANHCVEDWCDEFIRSTDLEHKLDPGSPPKGWAAAPESRSYSAPGRPAELTALEKAPRSLRRIQLAEPRNLARLFHTFLHHELQAAELMAWAILRWPDTPSAFRRGLLSICRDEIRHMGLYRNFIEDLGYPFGTFGIRDWFWQRSLSCTTPLQFVALMGMGFEGGNLDHTLRYVEWFRELGLDRAADIQEQVGREEVPHVRFGIQWFQHWTGGVEFERWRSELVDPLTPSMLRGKRLDHEGRAAAGFDDGFLAALDAYR